MDIPNKKIIIAVGGTGGHVYPAMGFAARFRKKHPAIDVLFVGGGLSQNRFFDREQFSYRSVACGNFSRGQLLQWPKNLWNIVKGVGQSKRILTEYTPDLVIGFGSYYTLPVLAAAKRLSLPIVLHEANSIPGKVNSFFSGHVISTGIHFSSCAPLLKGKTIEVGMPLRQGYEASLVKREEALSYFGLSPDLPTLLIFGGSQGARFINRLVRDSLDLCLDVPFQLLHFTGNSSMVAEIADRCRFCKRQAVVKEFENRMELAWKVADMVVSRAGASTIAEAMEFDVPALFIPYPYAEKHQYKNADFVTEHVKGAYAITEDKLTPQVFARKLEEMLGNNQKKLQDMRQSIADYKTKNQTANVFSWIEELLYGSE